jgi:hypothetical protein
MPVEQLLEFGDGIETPVLLLDGRVGEVAAECDDAVAVLLLPAANRAVELPLGDAL